MPGPVGEAPHAAVRHQLQAGQARAPQRLALPPAHRPQLRPRGHAGLLLQGHQGVPLGEEGAVRGAEVGRKLQEAGGGQPAGGVRPALEGLQAPDFTLPDIDGVPRTLSQLRGKKVFVATWASW